MGNIIVNSKPEKFQTTKLGDQMLTAAVLRQERNFEMPKKIRDENSDKYGYEPRGTFGASQSPYYQPVSAIGHAKNTVN